MGDDLSAARDAAERYLAPSRAIGTLGSGTDGIVLESDRGSAVKVHARPHTFSNELHAYQRIRDRGGGPIRGFAVPELLGWSVPDLLIEIGIVEPPYLIDFGKCTLDGPPPGMPRELLDEAMERMEDRFEDNFREARLVYGTLIGRFGVYNHDLSPDNPRFARPPDPGALD